ncbi:hypothetical protein EB118_17745 [bacterium]|nr:hypothetical protein [bacterium]NDG31903.1 hypothetical protein [bacterium]
MFDVRFHLGAGEHYKHWQVKSKDEVLYYNPKQYYFMLHNCTLKNKRGTAEKVFSTQKRDVCGFVRCEDWELFEYTSHYNMNYEYGGELLYDPKIAPFWRMENSQDSYDNTTYKRLITFGRRIFILP